jgi:NitT/TauT family transport system permease protein
MGFGQKVGVVTVVCKATMAINAYRGLTDLKPFTLDLNGVLRRPPKSAKFFKLRLPNSLPSIFTALKINIANAHDCRYDQRIFRLLDLRLGFPSRITCARP